MDVQQGQGGEDNSGVSVFQIILFQILLNFPVRLLLQFRCVCKEWCELIDSRVFKDAYLSLRRAMSVGDQLIVLQTTDIHFVDEYTYRISPVSLSCWYGDYQSLVSRYALDPPPSSSSFSNDFEISDNSSVMACIMNHLDGIVCFIDDGDSWFSKHDIKNYRNICLDITLMNPALREIRKLPVPVFDLLGGIFKRRLQGVGFGYDDSSDEYKVVAIVTVYEDEEGYGAPCKHIAMVYHLSTNSWTILDDIYEFMSQHLVSFTLQESVFSHGSLHWCIQWRDDKVGPETRYRILAFDMASESFREMPFPNGYEYYPPYQSGSKVSSLFKVDKSTIGLVSYTIVSDDEPVVEVWMMKEYGDNDSWTKQCTITNLPVFVEPQCFRNQDEILFYSGHSELICYDLVKGQLVDKIQIRERVRPVTGHESFVSVKQV